MRPKFVVTGGAGFIGSSIVRALLAEGADRVAVVDNLTSGKLANLEAVQDRVETHISDIRDYQEMKDIFSGAEIVWHLAAIPSVPRSIADPVPSHDVNINGTFSVCGRRKTSVSGGLCTRHPVRLMGIPRCCRRLNR